MRNLGLRGPRDVQLQIRALLLENAFSKANGITPLAAHSSMKAMLFSRMIRLLSRHSGGIGVASRSDSADFIRLPHGSAASQTKWKDHPVSQTSLTDTTPRSHRPGETAENYARRLTRARLKKSERAEIASLYERLDAERAAAGLPPADRVPWSSVDILEWQDLTPRERYLDLKTYALASDRIARVEHRGVAADARRLAA